jgi:histidyl-tRNA synthetase
MRMIDKKEREALKEYLTDIGADHLGLLELIDLKGMGALDRAVEISRDLERTEVQEASSTGKKAVAEETSKEGRTSSRTGRRVGAELKLDEFQEMIGLLEAYGVSATIDFEIVRGLEYYSGTVFEIYAEGLGAQRQICGGGTYELSSLFGGAEISSTGFGLGFDRIMEIELDVKKRAPVVIVYTPDVKAEAVKIAKDLRQRFPVIVDVMGRGLGAQLKAAASAGAKSVIIVGRNELDCGKLTLRDMVSGQQESLSLEEIAQKLGEEYACPQCSEATRWMPALFPFS